MIQKGMPKAVRKEFNAICLELEEKIDKDPMYVKSSALKNEIIRAEGMITPYNLPKDASHYIRLDKLKKLANLPTTNILTDPFYTLVKQYTGDHNTIVGYMLGTDKKHQVKVMHLKDGEVDTENGKPKITILQGRKNIEEDYYYDARSIEIPKLYEFVITKKIPEYNVSFSQNGCHRPIGETVKAVAFLSDYGQLLILGTWPDTPFSRGDHQPHIRVSCEGEFMGMRYVIGTTDYLERLGRKWGIPSDRFINQAPLGFEAHEIIVHGTDEQKGELEKKIKACFNSQH